MLGRLLALIGAFLIAGAVQAATPAQQAAAAPGSPGPLRLVATRVAIPATSAGGNKYAQAMSGHIAASNISKIGVAVVNWMINNTAESYLTNPGTVRFYIGYNGKCAPLTFNGSFTGVLPASGTLFSDVVTLPFVIPKGATFDTFEYRVIPSGGIPFLNVRDAAAGDNFFVSSTPIADLRCGTPGNTGNFSLPPAAIFGPGTNPSAIIAGDSIAYGFRDVMDSDYHAGFTNTYMLPASLVTLNLSSPGLKAADYTNNPSFVAQRIKLFKFASTTISELGTNDVHVGGFSAAQTEGFLANVYTLFPANAKVIQTTIASETGSTNAWTTTAGQSADGGQAILNTLNADIKNVGNVPALARRNDFYDTAALFTPSGLWPVTTRSPASVSDGSATASSQTLTSATAAFAAASSPSIAADAWCAVSVSGAGASGGLLTDSILSVSNSTTVTMGTVAGTTATGATITFAVTNDGIHPCPWGYKAVGPLDTTKLQ